MPDTPYIVYALHGWLNCMGGTCLQQLQVACTLIHQLHYSTCHCMRATDGLAALLLLYKQTIIYNCSHIAFSIACVGIGIYVIEGMINNSSAESDQPGKCGSICRGIRPQQFMHMIQCKEQSERSWKLRLWWSHLTVRLYSDHRC